MKVTTIELRKRSITFDYLDVKCMPLCFSGSNTDPFLKNGFIQCVIQDCGNTPCWSISSASIRLGVARTSAHSLSIFVGSKSGPVALSTFSPWSILVTASSGGTGSLSYMCPFCMTSVYGFCAAGIRIYFAVKVLAN